MLLDYPITTLGTSINVDQNCMMMLLVYFFIFIVTTVVSSYILKAIHLIFQNNSQHPIIEKYYKSFEGIVEFKTLINYQFISACILSIMCSVILLFLNINPIILIVFILFSAVVGITLPYFYYWLQFRRRQKDIENKFMDFIIALVDTIKIGRDTQAALEDITKLSTGPIHDEFRNMILEISAGTPLPQALTHLRERNPFEDMKLFTISLSSIHESGGQQVEVLEELVKTIQERRKFEEELRILTASGRQQVKFLSFAPLVFLGIMSLVARDMMIPMWTTTGGWICIGIIILLVALSALWIHKIVSINI